MEAKDLKNAIKANFERLSFESAMEANNQLLAEYETMKGKRGVSAIVAYYKKQSLKDEVVEETPAPAEEEQVNDQDVVVEKSVNETEPVSEEVPNVSLYKSLTNEMIDNALENGGEELNEWCIIKEYWEQKSDTEVVRSVEMFVGRDPETKKTKGWNKWDDANNAAKGAGISSFRKKGDLSLSEEGYPIGEAVCMVRMARIGEALTKFKNRSNGIKEIKVID